jgi:hypothetical protein
VSDGVALCAGKRLRSDKRENQMQDENWK